MPNIFNAELFTYSFPLNFTAAGQEIVVDQNILMSGDFELFFIQDNHPNALTFQIVDQSSSEQVLNNFLAATTLTGTGQRPFILPVSRFFQANRTIQVRGRNGGVAANAGTLVLVGATLNDTGKSADESQAIDYARRFDLGRQGTRGEFYAYGLDVNFTAPGQRIIQSIQVHNTLAFEAFYIMSSHATPSNFTLQITDSSSGKTLFRDPVAADQVTGTGQRPFRLPVTRIFRANGNILVDAINSPIAGAQSGQIVLAGANLIRAAM